MVAKSIWHLVAIFCGIVLLLSDDVNGLRCFQCNSQYDKGCFSLKANDTTSPYYLECTVPEAEMKLEGTPFYKLPLERFCRKTYQKIFDRGGLEVVVRRCGWALHDKEDCYYTSNVGRKEAVCQCFSDGCNSSGRNGISIAAILTIPVLMLYL
ncbi:uncharacterized protein LOC106665004 [Cimex lectularius]|uniref:Protein sleepless n=1 Tax=Cimex lectularius TaxID=79782 RepID=A0A8I6RHW2_CIMLE|nr:uncharacterized protein LOC106665004 [Cimex lectularius]